MKKNKTKLITLLVLVVVIIAGVGIYTVLNHNSTAQALKDGDYVLGRYEPATGCYLGAYVVQDELLGGDMAEFNELTGKKHATFFRYFGYKEGDLKTLQEWLDEVEAVGGVPQVSLEPNQGLDEVVDDDYLHQLAEILDSVDGPVFLRFASEMNGDWTNYCQDSELYIEKWRLIHDFMEEHAPDVLMLWTVFSNPTSTMDDFYPGDEYVDWVGVNIYNVVYHNDNIEDVAVDEDPLDFLDYVYNHYGDTKPIQISEYGVTHYTVTDDDYHVDFACEKLTRMYSYLEELYPRVKAIYYFDVNNLVNAPEGRKINDYSLTSDEEVMATYQELISDDYFLSDFAEDHAGELAKDVAAQEAAEAATE